MSAPPRTALVASPEDAAAIREAVSSAGVTALGPGSVLANRAHVAGVLELLADPVRSTKLIERMGFVRMGERDAIRPDGTIRRSHYWEMTRDAWNARRAP
jgi:hypothetical protein